MGNHHLATCWVACSPVAGESLLWKRSAYANGVGVSDNTVWPRWRWGPVDASHLPTGTSRVCALPPDAWGVAWYARVSAAAALAAHQVATPAPAAAPPRLLGRHGALRLGGLRASSG